MSEDAKLWPEGTVVRVTGKSVSGDAAADDVAATEGREYKVYCHVLGDDRDNDDPEKRPYYMLDVEGSYGGVYWAYPEHVEVVQTIEQLAAREIPSIKDVSRVISSGMHSAFGSDGMEFYETELESHGDQLWVVGHGKTDDGLRFGVRIAVLKVWDESDF